MAGPSPIHWVSPYMLLLHKFMGKVMDNIFPIATLWYPLVKTTTYYCFLMALDFSLCFVLFIKQPACAHYFIILWEKSYEHFYFCCCHLIAGPSPIHWVSPYLPLLHNFYWKGGWSFTHPLGFFILATTS